MHKYTCPMRAILDVIVETETCACRGGGDPPRQPASCLIDLYQAASAHSRIDHLVLPDHLHASPAYLDHFAAAQT